MRKGFYDLKVGFVIKEMDSTIQIGFNIPEKHTDDFIFSPGKYLTLKVTIDEKSYRRAYSICSSNSDKKTVSVLVKRLEAGKVSNFLNDEIKPGSTIAVLPPMGNFKIALQNSIPINYLLIGAGSGITPLLSMITSVLDEESENTCHLLYGNSHENSIIFKSKLDRLALVYANRFTVDYVLSKPILSKEKGVLSFLNKGKQTWLGSVGRINETLIAEFLKKNQKNNNNEYYICGPGAMIEASVEALHNLEIEKSLIHREYFTSADPKAVEETDTLLDDKEILKKAIITLDGETTELAIATKTTIVDALLNKGIEPPYSCLSGSCSSCKAKITEGKVKMDINIGLEEGEEEEGFILTCQSHLLTDTVRINYDTI